MERETALQQLQDIRREILAIHSEMEKCQSLQKQVEKLQKEKDHPAEPSVSLKSENTADKLKQSFEQQNREQLRSSKLPQTLLTIVSVAAQVIVAVLLALDIFGKKGLIISPEALLILNAEGSSNSTILFVVHLAAAILLPLFLVSNRGHLTGKRKIIRCILAAVLLFTYAIMCKGVMTYTYLLLLLGGVVLAVAASGIARAVQKGKLNAKETALTLAQKKQLEDALAADKRAKAENARRTAEAKRRWDEERQNRLPEIDREIREKAQQFDAARQEVMLHMENLAAMDALCEDDKTLQTVDLLIRFIQTRRADSIKEALQEYDKLMANRQLLEIEKQKLAAELQRSAQEHADRMQKLEAEKRHQAEMEYLAWDSAQSRAKMAGQLDHLSAMIYYGWQY